MMKLKAAGLISVALLMVITSTARAQGATCLVTAYLNDPDPKGTNIRSAANAKSEVIATITDLDSQVDIIGSSGDWLRVRKVRSLEGTVSFNGDGWIFASLLAVRARHGAVLHATPERTAAHVMNLLDEDVLTLRACRGEWLQVKHHTTTGWIERDSRCANPVTTCS